jgi:hypothetical protein
MINEFQPADIVAINHYRPLYGVVRHTEGEKVSVLDTEDIIQFHQAQDLKLLFRPQTAFPFPEALEARA